MDEEAIALAERDRRAQIGFRAIVGIPFFLGLCMVLLEWTGVLGEHTTPISPPAPRLAPYSSALGPLPAATSSPAGVSSAPPGIPPTTTERPPEELLAIIDNGTSPPPAISESYGRLLDSLGRQCSEGRMQLADMATNASQRLQQRTGRIFTTKTVLENFLAGTRSRTGDVACGSDFAGIMVLMEQER